MPPERRKKYGRGIKSYRYEGVVCYALLMYAASNAGLNAKKIKFSYNEKGKPHTSGLNFNFSHCKECVICAVSDGNVGADIQQESNASQAVIEKYCTVGEREKLLCGMPFNRLWTQKEAIVKYTGEGVAALDGLCDLSCYDGDGVSYETPYGYILTSCIGGCAVSVCSGEKETEFVEITPDMLREYINGLT
ncbi:MAG: 4'-phosphopantetheinyl transferase superfamily protein [Clostridia bacterium]|nr:4'-phosphopantetheinyl transferase superfamily protein [Clostridia bacterium]